MTSQNIARYQPHSSVSSPGDSFQSSKRRALPAQFESQYDHGSRSAPGKMSYDTDCISLPFHPPTHAIECPSSSIPISTAQWHGSQDTGDFRQEPFELSPTRNIYESQDGSIYKRGLNRRAFGDFQWNSGSSSHDSRLAYSSLTCPRTFPQDTAAETVMRSTTSHAHPPSAYSINPLKNFTQPSVSSYENLQFGPSTYHNIESSNMYSHQIGFQTHSPVLSRSVSRSSKADMASVITLGDMDNYDIGGNTPGIPVDESDGDASASSEPYAQLIYRALKSVPDHRMILKDIYDWFEKNTDKAKNKDQKGWQNSIRHNLSMNGAFKKVDQVSPSDESKKGYIWVLEPDAIMNGVESTTRYRRTAPTKKSGRTEPAATQRQRSGAKGGKATKKAAKLRRSVKSEEQKDSLSFEKVVDDGKPIPAFQECGLTMDMDDYDMTNVPYYSRTPLFFHTPSSTVHSSTPETSSYTFGDITGCTSGIDNEPLFYDDFDSSTDPTLLSRSLCDPTDHLLGCNFN